MITSTAAASIAGPVPIGAFDVVPDGATSETQAVGTQLDVRTIPFTPEDFTTGQTLLSGEANDAADATAAAPSRTDGTIAQGNAISFVGDEATTTFTGNSFVALDDLAPPIIDTPVSTGIAQGSSHAIILDRPTPVPLPAALYTGVIGLSTVVWAKRRMTR